MGSTIIDGSPVTPVVLGTVSNPLVSEFVTSALEEIRVIYPGEAPSPEDMDTGIKAFNRLISSSNLAKSSIFTTRMDLFVLTANQQSYTWGIDPNGVLTADIALPRPIKIKNIILQYSPAPNIVRQPPLAALNDAEWASKLVPGITAIPFEYYNDGANPLSTLYFFPSPNSAYTVELWTWQTAGKFSDLTTEVIFPDGYEDFWHYQLSSRLCGPYRKAFSDTQNRELALAIRRISETNSVPSHISYDPAITGSSAQGRFNYIRGPYR